MSTTDPAATKIVIVAGQEFSVPAATDNEAIRQQLLSMGFADVGTAEIKKGKRGDQETVEFIKKAGTKGLTGGALAARLAHVPRAPVPPAELQARQIVGRLLAGQLTCAEAAADDAALNALDALDRAAANTTGRPLCQRLDELPAVASLDARPW